jgi:DNA-binding GntR family transcriptional regulator
MKAAGKPTKRTPRSTPPRQKNQTPINEQESMVQQAYLRIEDDIARLELPPGQIVSENMLAARFGFGRTPVREALQQLAREGLVLILPKRGIVISEIDVRKQLRLIEVRRYVEHCVVLLAARRASEAERARFATLAKELDVVSANQDGDRFLALDREFNALILTAARNEYATASMKLTQGLSRRFWFAHYKAAANLSEAVQLHAGIARAISEGNEEEALSWLRRLLDNVEAFTRASLDADPL